MDFNNRLRSSRSEANLRRKPAPQHPPVPPPPAQTFNIGLFSKAAPPTVAAPQHPAYGRGDTGLAIRISPRPDDGYDTGEDGYDTFIDEYANRNVAKPVPPLPLRLPSRAGPPPPPVPQAQQEEVAPPLPQRPPPPYRTQTLASSSDDVPGLSPSRRARPGAFMSKSRPTTPVSSGNSPLTPTSFDEVFPAPTALGRAATTVPPTDPAAAEAAAAKKPSFFKDKADAAKEWAAGLIPHPTLTTKDFTVMRHTFKAIMYRGAETSVSISIFSKHPLPQDRTLWMQRRGTSGDTGMKIKAMIGATADWRDVTPASRADTAAVPEADERTFHRDARKWLKDGAGKSLDHLWRETHVVRIPADLDDGYFRLVLCTYTPASSSDPAKKPKRKVLCYSPDFRVFSASKDPSVMRGASLSTMPLEVGVKVFSTVATVYASKYTKPVQMLAGTAGGKVAKAAEKTVTKSVGAKHGVAATKVGKAAWNHLGMHAELQGANAQYNASMSAGRYDAVGHRPTVHGDKTVGADAGPEAPYPLKFSGRVVRGAERSTRELGFPTASLEDVPEEMRLRLRGVYFGWAYVVSQNNKNAPLDSSVSDDWHVAVITVGPAANTASVAAKPTVVVHILHDFSNGSGAAASSSVLIGAKLKLMVMGYLRPRLHRDSSAQEHASHFDTDRMLASHSLARSNWGPDAATGLVEAAKAGRTFSDKVMGLRDKAQLQVFDRVPVHKLGFRTESAALMDRVHGNGGFWVARNGGPPLELASSSSSSPVVGASAAEEGKAASSGASEFFSSGGRREEVRMI